MRTAQHTRPRKAASKTIESANKRCPRLAFVSGFSGPDIATTLLIITTDRHRFACRITHVASSGNVLVPSRAKGRHVSTTYREAAAGETHTRPASTSQL